MAIRYIIIVFMLFIGACNTDAKKRTYTSSRDVDSIVLGYYMLTEADTEYVAKIFENTYDPRVSFSRYYGNTVYQAKMNALKRISGLEPPKKITYRVDTSIIEYYRAWAKSNGYIN